MLSELKKTGFKYNLRYVTDLAFAWGLKTGILLKMSTYPIEYGAFRRDTSLQDMRRTLKDINENGMTGLGIGKERLTGDMVRLLQETLSYYKHPRLDQASIKRLTTSIIAPLAEEMAKGKAGISDFVFIFSDLSSDTAHIAEAAEKKYTALGLKQSQAPAAEENPAEKASVKSESRQKSFTERLVPTTADLVSARA